MGIAEPDGGSWMLLRIGSMHGPDAVDAVEDVPLHRASSEATDAGAGLLRERFVLRERDGIALLGEITRPREAAMLPTVLYLHGGAFCSGSCDDASRLVGRIAQAGFVVCSVAYGLAPEHPFPHAVEDAVYAARWLGAEAERFGGRPGEIAVAGDSSGANLAAAVAGYLAGAEPSGIDEGDLAGRPVRISGALLLAGIYDFRGLAQRRGVDRTLRMLCNEAYLGPTYLQHHDNPLVSPIRAPTLRAFPPTFLASRSDDPLLHQTLSMGRALAAVDVPTTMSVAMSSTASAETEVERAIAWLVQTVRDPPPRIGSAEHPVTRALA